ncbi:PREDICTED: bestrophin-4 isoform X2 [Nicrophorus vespilloides]|uniref:Bestrophin homolog n=1 Tax=Nicrophorus vespilloides TaxID=110193 RepID=A0ABM1N842_NICVS|nr:PREDICTED: bestrophin-4 isoform X2 [Nicrophorus vespilloides]
MTVTYTAEVATCRGLGCFLKLLRRWRGSIYKLVWLDLLLFLILYYSLNLMYRFILNENQKVIFENVVQYCKNYSDLIPLSFVLGFYVSIVMTRWWNQYTTIPFPDPLAVFVSATIHGNDERGRVMRRTIMRYVCLCVTMMFTMISPRVKKRFPTLDHFVEAGLLQQSEKHIIADLNQKFPKYSKHWLPIVWASSIITRARKEGRIRDDFAVKTMIDELNKFRGQCGLLLNFDTISIPLVYTQTVTLAVYSYFLTTLMGHQWVEHSEYKFDLYFPVFTLLQFFFYMGWLKVAESLINPFGDDDDDFEINWMIDRNLQVSYLIVDDMHHEHPELVRDQYWDEVFPPDLPHTLASEPFKEQHPLPSTANIACSPTGHEISGPPTSVKIDDDMQSGIMFSVKTDGGMKRGGNSQASNLDSIQRVASVTSMIKKFFNREDSRMDSRTGSRRGSTVELNNLVPPKTPTAMKITDQIIEELDEQQTLTSMREAQEQKPSVFGIFGPPPPSQPVQVPTRSAFASRQESHTSAYSKGSAPLSEMDNISIGSETIDGSDVEDCDEFNKLKKRRLDERKSRLVLNLARSMSNNPGEGEGELLMGKALSGQSPPIISRMDSRLARSLSGGQCHMDILLDEERRKSQDSTDEPRNDQL